MSLKVTFDSNIFQHVLRPHNFPGDSEINALQAINCALKNGNILGFIPETMADLEAIKRDDRASYFSSRTWKINTTTNVLPNDSTKVSASVSPDPNAHPGIQQILFDCFSEALDLGFKFLRCPRIGLPRPQFLQDQWFALESDRQSTRDRQERFFAAAREIEARGVGKAVVEKIGNSFVQAQGTHESWFEGLAYAQTKQDLKQVANAVSEWADGDAVATHIGYQNNLFCTRDKGVGAVNSVLNVANRTWLNSNYGVEFVTVSGLASRVL